jgi:hypothetical protein
VCEAKPAKWLNRPLSWTASKLTRYSTIERADGHRNGTHQSGSVGLHVRYVSNRNDH